MKPAFVLLCALGGALLSPRALSQPDMQTASGGTAVSVQAVSFSSETAGKTRLNVYVQFPYNAIAFEKEDTAYVGRLEIAAHLEGTAGETAWQQNLSVELRANDFAQTVSDRFSTTREMSALVAPGRYTLFVQVTDRESKKPDAVKREIVVPDYERDSLSLSDILVASKVTFDGGRMIVVPNVGSSFGEKAASIHLFFEAYAHVPMDSVRLRISLRNAASRTIASGERVDTLTGRTTQLFWQIAGNNLTAGKYRIVIEAIPFGTTDTTTILARTSTTFAVQWHDLPPTITNLDAAVEQLRYIARDSELDYIREAPTAEEKKKRFLEFWSKRDPDPKTPRNELMEEYYARVAYANKTFSHFTEGWKSDMGMVFIHFGTPDNVERHPFEIDSRPYEVWSYYQLNREFVFVDESGFGDYRLRYPMTDLWGRIR